MFHTAVGKYTEEELDTALVPFRPNTKPLIFTYFTYVPLGTARADYEDLMSLWAFQMKVRALGHFYTTYQTADPTKLHYNQQLEKLAANGFMEFRQDRGRLPHRAATATKRPQPPAARACEVRP